MTTTKELLQEAKALIEKGWTQGVAARDDEGIPVPSTSPVATCWCVYGALSRAEDNLGYQSGAPYAGAVDAIAGVSGKSLLAVWNDAPGRTKKEVLDTFQKAIDSLE
ncbi:hypothetical protein [Myxococcus phage Mx1]|nr:hypothetical protein [Myxococcus phage Mx1]